MPLLPTSGYRSPLWLRNGHLQTAYPVLLRKMQRLVIQRERIATADGDFLDLDWLSLPAPENSSEEIGSATDNHSHAPCLPPTTPTPAAATQRAAAPSAKVQRPLAILTHGLEGSSTQGYMLGMARTLLLQGWDVLAWNLRGCSGEDNWLIRSYHSGATDDLHTVLAHVNRGSTSANSISQKEQYERTGKPQDSNRPPASRDTADTETKRAMALPQLSTPLPQRPSSSLPPQLSVPSQSPSSEPPNYSAIALVGFSLGGNLLLKYLGENPAGIASNICGAVAISVPCQLAESTAILERRCNRLYMERFLKTLRAKVRIKHQRFPDAIDLAGLDDMRTFAQFDNRYTAPLNGFANAAQYWQTCSCNNYLGGIGVPTLLLNAQDDPFLGAACFPRQIAQQSKWLHLKSPRHGGHVGFVSFGSTDSYWSEQRAADFLQATL